MESLIETPGLRHGHLEENRQVLLDAAFASLLGEAIRRIHDEESVSTLFI